MLINRRHLLHRMSLGLSMLPAIVAAPRAILGSLLFDPQGELVPPKPLPPNAYVQDELPIVAMVHGQQIETMLREGLRLIGGLDRLALEGKRVLIKPNVVNDRPPPTTTNPALVAAVVRVARESRAREIIVADSSGIIRFPTSANLVATGIKRAAEAEGARVLALEDEPWVRVEPAGAKALSHYYISRPVYDADVFINLPVIKTHKFAHYSCALKNLVGITHPRYRPSVTFLAPDWHERIAELNLAVHPHLTIADGSTIMIAGGPTSGQAAPGNALLLSGDRIALDAVAVAWLRTYGVWRKVMETPVWRQRQIVRAMELGLGLGKPGRLRLITASLTGTTPEFEEVVTKIRRDLDT